MLASRPLRGALLALLLALGCAVPLRAAPDLPQVAPGAHKPWLAVLVWHDVVAGPKEVWFDTTRDDFARQLETIHRGNFHVISLDALTGHLARGTPVPARSIALTFDDNGSGLYANVFPLLRRYRYPATLFVHTKFVGVTTTKHHNTWEQLREMSRSGLVSIQSLTVTHPADLRAFPDAMVSTELRNSRAAIEKRIGRPVYAFVYPEDNYDDRLAHLVASQGYRIAFIEDWGNAGDSASMMTVHRYSILTRFDQALADVARGGP